MRLAISCHAATIETVVGIGKPGYSGDGKSAALAKLNQPFGLTIAPDGDIVFCDTNNHVIRRIDKKSGIIQTIVGSGTKGYSGDDSPAIKAELNEPYEVIFHPNGNLYWVERMSHVVRRMDHITGKITTIAGNGKEGFSGDGGPGNQATLHPPHSIAFDREGIALSPDGKRVYLVDTETHTIRAIDLTQTPPTLELIAGDGTRGDGPDSPDPLKCRMARLHGVAIDRITCDLYLGDSENHKIRVIR